MVMRAREHVYHLDCFACHVCRYRFCVGDRFYLYYNTIRCQDHYYGDRGYFYQTPFFWWLKGISVSRVNSSLKLFLSFQDHRVKQQGNWDQVWLLIRFLNVFLTKIGNPLMRSQSYEWVSGLVLFSKISTLINNCFCLLQYFVLIAFEGDKRKVVFCSNKITSISKELVCVKIYLKDSKVQLL